jgi:diaminopropionate ammonia-lyase
MDTVSFGFRAVLNPLAGVEVAVAGVEHVDRARVAEILDFHRRLPGYEPTPLLSLPRLASTLGVRDLLVKAESTRFGLPAFKMLGASWATYRALRERLGATGSEKLGDWTDVEDLATRCKPLLPLHLAAATDGNHGRAVARMARWLGLGARIFVPAGTTAARIEAIEREGAEVLIVDGGYDAAVARSAEEEGPSCLVISDTSWPGYTDVPRWVIEGYSTMFTEIDDALGRAGHEVPEVVVVPIGVGALAAAAVTHTCAAPRPPAIIGVEPTRAACATASALAGELVTLMEPQESIMAGLNCGTPSQVAWPRVSSGVSGFVTIDDDWAREAVRVLAASGIEAGETGAAALGGLLALQRQGRATPLAELVRERSSVLVLVTEGASDAGAWREILGTQLLG